MNQPDPASYILVVGESYEQLEAYVNARLKAGWNLQGGVAVVRGMNGLSMETRYLQAMTHRFEGEDYKG